MEDWDFFEVKVNRKIVKQERKTPAEEKGGSLKCQTERSRGEGTAIARKLGGKGAES